MAQTTLWQENAVIWQSLRSKVKNAIVYLDGAVAELLHWSGGAATLIESGAADVREFSSFESADELRPKAVFVVSTPLEGITAKVIEDIITQSQFQYVVVMTSVSPLLHNGVDQSGMEEERVFEDFEDKVLEWMGNMNYTVEVGIFPVFSALVCQELFLAPTFSSLYPLSVADVKQISLQYAARRQGKENQAPQTLQDVELTHLPTDLQQTIKMLASGLHALLQVLDVKEDIFSLGHTARLVATELEGYAPARSRRKTCQNRASILLLDRSLDTSSALTQQTDSLLDKVVNTLPRLHTNDCCVDLSSLCHVNKQCKDVILPGCLASSDHSSLPTHLTPLIFKKQKEALMEVNRLLVETATSEKLPLKLSGRPGRVTADQLDTTLDLFCGNYPVISKHLDILQLSAATSQSLRITAKSGHLDSLLALEKNLVQTCADSNASDDSPSVLAVLLRAVMQEAEKEKEDRSLTVDDLLRLLTFAFSVSDGDLGDEEEESQMREKLVEMIMQDSEELPPITREIVGDKVSPSILPDIVESVWEKLEAVGAERSGFQQFSSVLDPGDAMSPAHSQPLVRQLMEAVVDPAKPDLIDVECRSGGIKDLLKSGFGFFKSAAKPRPGDAPLLVLFVIGGITASEVKQVRDILEKAKPDFQVLIGSSRLASQESTLKSVFINDNVNLAKS